MLECGQLTSVVCNMVNGNGMVSLYNSRLSHAVLCIKVMLSVLF